MLGHVRGKSAAGTMRALERARVCVYTVRAYLLNMHTVHMFDFRVQPGGGGVCVGQEGN